MGGGEGWEGKRIGKDWKKGDEEEGEVRNSGGEGNIYGLEQASKRKVGEGWKVCQRGKDSTVAWLEKTGCGVSLEEGGGLRA